MHALVGNYQPDLTPSIGETTMNQDRRTHQEQPCAYHSHQSMFPLGCLLVENRDFRHRSICKVRHSIAKQPVPVTDCQ